MRKNIFILIISVFTLIQGAAVEYPSETVVLKFSDNSEANWREITRDTTKEAGVIEFVPLNQSLQDWSELITIQHVGAPAWDKNKEHPLESFARSFQETTRSIHLPQSIFRIIEKNEKDIIYEWISFPQGASPLYEMARIFLTDFGFNRVGFMRKHEKISLKEREKWIKTLKDAFIAPFPQAVHLKGLSMVERLKDTVSLGDYFQSWEKGNDFSFQEGSSSVCYIPPTQRRDLYITECLEVVAMLNPTSASIDELFERNHNFLKEMVHPEVRLQIIERSPSEIIYSYCHPKDLLQLNAVVRAFRTDYGHYSISYKRGLAGYMEKEEILRWKDRLKTIKLVAHP